MIFPLAKEPVKRDYKIHSKDIGRVAITHPSHAVFHHLGPVHIWVSKVDYKNSMILRLKQFLAEDEIERVNKFYFEADRRRYIVSHAMARMVLARYLGLTPSQLKITFGPNNKPLLLNAPQPVFFNMSHSGNYALLATSLVHPVGIDIEEIKFDFDFHSIIGRYFNEKEQAVIYADKNNERDNFYKFWTRKEAILKTCGIGLINDLGKLDMSGKTSISPILLKQYAQWFSTDFYVRSFSIDENYAAAIASIHAKFEAECFWFDPDLFTF